MVIPVCLSIIYNPLVSSPCYFAVKDRKELSWPRLPGLSEDHLIFVKDLAPTVPFLADPTSRVSFSRFIGRYEWKIYRFRWFSIFSFGHSFNDQVQELYHFSIAIFSIRLSLHKHDNIHLIVLKDFFQNHFFQPLRALNFNLTFQQPLSFKIHFKIPPLTVRIVVTVIPAFFYSMINQV